MWHRTRELEGERYGYYRSYLGSYKDAYPYTDHYRLGALLCAYVRRHYGGDAWDRVLERVGKYFLLKNFDNALVEVTGRSIVQLYHDAMDEHRRLWKKQLKEVTVSPVKDLTLQKKGPWSSRLFPQQAAENSLVAISYATDDVAKLIEIKSDGTEKALRQVPASIAAAAFHNERGISSGGGRILWCETLPDPRWGYRTWKNLVIYDLATKKKKRITQGGSL